VEIRLQFVVEEQPQLVPTSTPTAKKELQQPFVEGQPQLVHASRLVEEKELQQLVSSGEEFLQELFEKRPISNIIPQCPKSRTKTMVKQKGKAHVKEQVEKPTKKKPMFKVKESQKMLHWMKMDSNELKWARQASLEGLFNLQWTTPSENLL
jgi:hypothetical protein